MKVFVIRHGKTEWNIKGLLQGSTNIPLSDFGVLQAKQVLKKLENEHIDICISSPLDRALDTARIICDNKIDIIIDDRLVERRLGNLEGKPSVLYDSKMYWNYELNSSNENVESIQDMFSRITSFYDYLKTNYKDKNVLIVTHGAIVRTLNFMFKGYDKDTDFLSFDVPNCTIYEYEI